MPIFTLAAQIGQCFRLSVFTIKHCELNYFKRLLSPEGSTVILLDLLYLLAFILLSPWWLAMLLIKPGFRAGIFARFHLRKDISLPQPSIWLHGSSAGEIDLLRPLVSKLERESSNCSIVVSVFSISGYTAAKKAFPEYRVIYFPADFSVVIRQFIRVLHPCLIVLVESEFWPNFIATVTTAGVPVIVLNGRMSQKSFRAHRRIRLIPWVLRKVSLFAVQTDDDASRFRDLGVEANLLRVTGNMKYDLLDPSGLNGWRNQRRVLRERYAIDEDMLVFVGGSIHRGEDVVLASAYDRLVSEGYRLRMIIVPRYPAESRAVSRALEQRGLVAVQKTEVSGDEHDIFSDPLRVLIVDTMGELRQFYAMSDIAYVGGSLLYRGSNKGGHNLMEPAICGAAVMFGPYNYSFRETVRDLLENHAGLLVHDPEEIYANLRSFLDDPQSVADMGSKARQVILNKRGATGKNFTLLKNYVPSGRAWRQSTSRYRIPL